MGTVSPAALSRMTVRVEREGVGSDQRHGGRARECPWMRTRPGEGQNGKGCANRRLRVLTALAVEYFFSVVMAEPLLLAAFRALWPRSTVSRGPPAPPRVLLPILVTEFQSSDILADMEVWREGKGIKMRRVVG